jgi:RNA polymerase sigma-70 factor (ECF subfamily)
MFRFARKKIDDLSDEELLDRYQQKEDIQVAGILFDRYVHLVYGVCLKYLKDREESKDAVMQIFEKIIIELKNREIHHFKSWLYAVSKNYCLMELRRKRTTLEISNLTENNDEFIMESSLEMNPIEEHLNDNKLKNCLEELSIEQKRCIELFYYKEKCYKEISEITKYDVKKVKSYIQNGKRNLKNCMEK